MSLKWAGVQHGLLSLRASNVGVSWLICSEKTAHAGDSSASGTENQRAEAPACKEDKIGNSNRRKRHLHDMPVSPAVWRPFGGWRTSDFLFVV